MANRTSFRSPLMDSRTQYDSSETKGNKPIREASTIFEIMVLMIVHVCKKILFFDTHLKIALYLGALFLLSLIADVLTFPRTYFSRSDNILNQYFVKIGWFWTLFLTVPYVLLTSYTICCGNRRLVLTKHVSRLIIATISWYVWTTAFNVIETKYGRCNSKNYPDKISCLKNGHFWNGFDLSGHCFLLIYSSLILKEEAKAMKGWERIKDYIREELYSRSIDDRSPSSNPLKNVTTKEMVILKKSYETFTPYVRGIFVGTACLQILWDVMLLSTIVYYHIMVEKFLSGVIAIVTWFVTYRVWYAIPHIYPHLPGDGVFKYNKEKPPPPSVIHRKRMSSANGKHFMGMPLNKGQDNTEAEETKL